MFQNGLVLVFKIGLKLIPSAHFYLAPELLFPGRDESCLLFQNISK